MNNYDVVEGIWTHAIEAYDKYIDETTASEIMEAINMDDRAKINMEPKMFAFIWNRMVDTFIADNQ